jgi:minichromosome loss Mcl1-like protein/DNA polymerase alpha-binding protein Ctf4
VTDIIPVEIDGKLCIISSSLDKSIQMRVFDAASHGLALPLRQIFLAHPVTSMSMIKNGMIACMDMEGHVSVLEMDVRGSEVMGAVRKPVWDNLLDDEVEKRVKGKDAKKQSKTKDGKKSKNKLIDDEAEGDDSMDQDGTNDHTDEDMNADQDEVMDFEDDDLLGDYVMDQRRQGASSNAPPTNVVHSESRWRHPRVHANATAWRNKCRILTWNMFAMVASRKEGMTTIIEIEFADKRAHRPARFTDDHGWELAAISEAGLVLAMGRRVMFVTLVNTSSAYAPHSGWSIDFKEDVVAVSCTEMHVTILTDTGILHVLTSTGVPMTIFSVPSDGVISVCMHGTMIAIFSTLDAELSCHLYDFKQQLTESHRVCSISKDRTVIWSAFSEQGQLVMYDSTGILLSFNGSLWIPVLKVEEACWPVYVTSTELHAILSTSMPEGNHPDPYPAPLITPLPFCIPTCGCMENADFTLPLLSSHLPSVLSSVPERERKRSSVAADKCLLELIQMAIKSDEMQRVVDLAKLAILPKTLDMAIQLAKHAQLNSLASRLEFVKLVRGSS